MGKIGVIVENKVKYVSFDIDVVVDSYTDDSGKVKEKKIQFRFIDSFRFMAPSLDAPTNNLVGVSGMVCDNSRGTCELTHIDEDYIAHGKCKSYYSGYSKRQLNVDSIHGDFANLRTNLTDKQFRLLLRKGVYPYEHMTSWDKFNETELPPKEAFYSKLNMSDISSHVYSHTQKVWKGFDIRNL